MLVGLAFLATKKFIHRDIAARNVLKRSDGRCVISDFGEASCQAMADRDWTGLARESVSGSDYYKSSGNVRIPVRWTAPEALFYRKVNTCVTSVLTYYSFLLPVTSGLTASF